MLIPQVVFGLLGESKVLMDAAKTIPASKAIIEAERRDGCVMAHEFFIEPAMRRWRSYARRLKRHKDQSLEHRAHDLEKGLVDWYVENHGYGYDPSCIRHLAHSFAEVLFQTVEGTPEAESEQST